VFPIENVHIELPPGPPNPYPPSGIKTDINIHLAGKTLDQFVSPDFQIKLKEFILSETQQFCKKNNITITVKPT